MYLKRLEIVGFKSFTERTTVPFSPGISSVVGPNGCGKSNIIDAIRWVMGEQSPRRLRARAMEDILFNGSKGRAPAALAEVTLVLARELESAPGLAEVGVTRRLYRGGDSEYLINKSLSRLKDVLRFFMEAGMGTRAYNIIEQEKVGRLVDARPEDRRLLLDEAAGIVRFKERKKESERKIESAERNMEAVEALLAETKKSLAEVTKAAAKANRYKAMKEELKELELALSARRFLDLRAQSGSTAEEKKQRLAELTELATEADQADLALENLRLEETALERRLEDELAAYHELTNALKTLRLEEEHARTTLASAFGRREKAIRELEELETDLDRRQTERDELTAALSRLEADSQNSRARRDELKERRLTLKSALERLNLERETAERQYRQNQEALRTLRENLAGAESLRDILIERRGELELEKNQGDLALSEAHDKVASRERFLAALREDLKAKDEDLAVLREDLEVAKEDLETAVRALSGVESEAAALEGRLNALNDLKNAFSWYPAGVKALLEEPNLQAELIGPVAESLDIPPGYEAAVEAALGERLAWIVAKDRLSAIAAVEKAKAEGLGRAGFVTLAELKDQDLLTSLLGECHFVEDLAAAKDELFALTQAGEYLAPTVVVGGSSGEKGEDAGLLARLKAVEEAEERFLALKTTVAAENSKVVLARENRQRAESALMASQSSREGLAADLAKADSNLLLAKSEAEGLAIRLRSLDAEMAQAMSRLAETEAQRIKAEEAKEALATVVSENAATYQELDQMAREREAELAELSELSQEAATAADIAVERFDNAKKSLKEAEEWLDDLDGRRLTLFNDAETLGLEIEALSRKADELEKEALGLPEKTTQAEGQVAELRQIRETSRSLAQKREEEAKEARKKKEAAATTLNQLERRDQETAFELKRLNENLLTDWRVVLTDLESGYDPLDEELAATETLNLAANSPELEANLGLDLDALDPCGALLEEATLGLGLKDDSETSGFLEPERDDSPSSTSAWPQNAASLGSVEILLNEAEVALAASVEPRAGESWPGDQTNLKDLGRSLTAQASESLAESPAASSPAPNSTESPIASSLDPSSTENPVASSPAASSTESPIASSLDPSSTENPVAVSPADPGDPEERTEEGKWANQPPPPERLDARLIAAQELPPGAEATRAKLKDRLAAMGEISLSAIEKETELRERYDDQKKRYDDLLKAIADLKNGINRVNQTCRELFAKTFKEADAKFREIFPVLFEGGEGWLGLSDENDPLESGVEIHVHPPGKKIMVMSLLSGGEKALTALALIFALYLIKPSPFCLLDEADAPLDEANIDRFNRLLRRLSEASQIIMVTHNKRTMQISDTLYGVTMETPGVSRLVSVSLEQAEVLTDV
ncbi:MAG: AAA family ATPase [Deltaproteobacteria bacterium]|jgi:chromosome segregation protein|nr:AAA family ATPase [Deltaproteobacteria bacterium]